MASNLTTMFREAAQLHGNPVAYKHYSNEWFGSKLHLHGNPPVPNSQSSNIMSALSPFLIG